MSDLVLYLREANVFFVVDGEGGDFVSVNFDEAAFVVLRSRFDGRRGRVNRPVHRHPLLEILRKTLLSKNRINGEPKSRNCAP